MNKKIEINASSISLYDLWMMIRRNLYTIIYFTVLGLVLGFVYTNMVVIPEYTATGYLTASRPNAAAVSSQAMTTITTDIKSATVANEAVTILVDTDVTLPNGNPITQAYILSGLATSSTTTSYRVTITFAGEYDITAVKIVNAVIQAAETVFTAEPYSTGLLASFSFISQEATVAAYTGPSNTLYLAIFVILGGVIGAGLGIFTDIFSDFVHYTGEIQALGINAFTVAYSDNKKNRSKRRSDPSLLTVGDLDIVDPNDFSNHYYRDILKLQNDIENFTPDKQVKTIGVTSTREYQSKASLLASIAHVYAKEHQKVLVLDFDFEHPFMHEVFNVHNDKNIVSYYLSYKGKEEFLERVNPYLFVLPGMTSALGSKIIKSDRVKKIIDEARKEYDYVLVNCPPTLKELTILSCAHLLDGVLVIGKIENTKKKEFVKTSLIIVDNDMHLIGGAFLKGKSEKKSLLSLFSK